MKKVYFTQVLVFIISLLISLSAVADEGKFKPYNPIDLHKTVYIDGSFNRAERKNIILALYSWEDSTRGLVKFAIITNVKPIDYGSLGDYDNTIFITPTGKEEIDIANSDKKYTNGLQTVGLCILRTYYVGTVIEIVVDRVSNGNFKAVVMHEIGHSLGLMRHIENSHSIMNSNIEAGSKKIGQIDLRALCDLYFCNSNIMMPINY